MRYAVLILLPLMALSAAEPETSLTRQEVSFLKQAMSYNLREVKAAEMALEHALLSDLRAYAQELIREHSAAVEILKKLAESKQVIVPSKLTDQELKELFLLFTTPNSGISEKYLEDRIQSHTHAISRLKDLRDGGTDDDLKAFAVKVLDAIEKGLVTARRLENQY